MAGVEGDDFRSLLDDLVPSSERPERLEPPFPGSERLWGYADRAVVRADRIDASARLAQQLGPAGPCGRVSVSLTERLVGDQREDAAISFDIIGIEVHDLHVRADRLWPLLQCDMGVPLPLPQIFGLRIDAQSGVVISERIGRALLREEDVSLEAEGSKVSSVASQRVRGRGLGGLDSTDPEKPRPDRRIGFLKILDPCPRLLRSEDLERLDERDRCAAVRVHLERRKTGLRESVRFVEHSSFSVEETLEEGHPYHPIPRGAVNSGPRRTSGRHGKWMTYRYRQGPVP